MGDSQLCHVVVLVSKRDEVVVYPRLIFSCVVEVEVFGLDVIRCKFLGLKLGDILDCDLFTGILI